MNKKQFHDNIMNLLKPHGPITSRAMFGGYGIYYEKAMFACIVENELYFRINPEIESFFDEYRSKQFVYIYPDGKSIKLPYKTLPEVILNDENQLRQWILRSYQVALQAKLKKQTKSKKAINLSDF
jgi:DNA transformation protein